nr:DUF2269 domain-containing protein [Tahibacter harae]
MSATIVFGTGVGSAWYFLVAARSRDPRIVAFVAEALVLADGLFTATTLLLQPLSGAWLVHRSGLAWSSTWLRGSLLLFAVAALCWLRVVVLQLRMRTLAREAVAAGTALPAQFGRCLRQWVVLGFVALFCFLGIFYFMVFRPVR